MIPVIISWLNESPIPTCNTVISLDKFCLAFLRLRDERYLKAWRGIWDCSDDDYSFIYLITTPPLTRVSWDIPVALWMHFHLRHGYLNPETQFLMVTERSKIMSVIAIIVLSLFLGQNLSRGCTVDVRNSDLLLIRSKTHDYGIKFNTENVRWVDVLVKCVSKEAVCIKGTTFQIFYSLRRFSDNPVHPANCRNRSPWSRGKFSYMLVMRAVPQLWQAVN